MSPLVEAVNVRSTVEAQLIVGMLNAEGIDAVVSTDDLGGLEPQFQLTAGVRVLVPADVLVEAQALIADAQSAD